MTTTINTTTDLPVVLGSYAYDEKYTLFHNYTGNLTIGPSGVVAPVGGTGFVFVRYGAFGVYVREAGATLTNQGSITAAYGGHDARTIQEDGENGSVGGIGVMAASSAQINNSGTITGGLGGTGSVIGNYHHLIGKAGDGGAGVDLSAANAMFTNSNAIVGGAGGTGDGAGNGGAGLVISAAATLGNSGSITGGTGGVGNYVGGNGGAGATLSGNGTLHNTGTIAGGTGGNNQGAHDAYFTHDGGSGGVGVDLAAGATLTNTGNGTISGGTSADMYAPQTTNTASAGVGVNLQANATFTNDATVRGGDGASGTFKYTNIYNPPYDYNPTTYVESGAGNGATGITVGAHATLTNNADGHITGGKGGDSPQLNPGNGGVGVALTAAGGTVTNAGYIAGGAGGNNVGGYSSGGAGSAGVTTVTGSTLVNRGHISGGDGGSGGYSGAGGNGGVGVYLNGGTVTNFGTISGGNGGAGFYTGSAGDAVHFSSTAGTFIVEGGSIENGAISGFAVGDTLDVANLAPTAVLQDFGVSGASIGSNLEFAGSGSGETLATTSSQNDGTLYLTGDFSGDTIVLSGDGSGGTDITLALGGVPPCYCRGTRIRTPTGERAVEELTVGELVLTASGEARPVRWLGHRRVDCTRYAEPTTVWPIRVRAGAFADQVPSRDLWLSPGHAILVTGVLIQAEKLVNGASIVQVPSQWVEYWHVELDSHDILIADGLTAESYLDCGNRTAFVNGGAYVDAHADFLPKHWAETCAPLVLEGPALVRAKETLLARAQDADYLGHALTDDAGAHVRVDGVRIEPLRLDSTRLAFVLPAEGSTIELHCRRYVPAQVRPASIDRRALGLCVRRLQIDGVDVPLDEATAFARGWHELECHPDAGFQMRWSQERVPLPAGTRLVVIECGGPGFYWSDAGSLQTVPLEAQFA